MRCPTLMRRVVAGDAERAEEAVDGDQRAAGDREDGVGEPVRPDAAERPAAEHVVDDHLERPRLRQLEGVDQQQLRRARRRTASDTATCTARHGGRRRRGSSRGRFPPSLDRVVCGVRCRARADRHALAPCARRHVGRRMGEDGRPAMNAATAEPHSWKARSATSRASAADTAAALHAPCPAAPLASPASTTVSPIATRAGRGQMRSRWSCLPRPCSSLAMRSRAAPSTPRRTSRSQRS